MKVSLGRPGAGQPGHCRSGTFGYGIEFEEIVHLERIGAWSPRASSMEPMAGHAAPRIIQTRGRNVERYRPPECGRGGVHQPQIAAAPRYPRCNVIVNVFGSTVGEYIAVIERLNQATGISAYE